MEKIMSLQHYDENTSIHFADSNKEEFIEAKALVERLLRLAPCNSHCNLEIKNKDATLTGRLELKTPDKTFSFEQKSEVLKELQSLLFNSVKDQLTQWKKERSTEDITGSIKLESFSIQKFKNKRQ